MSQAEITEATNTEDYAAGRTLIEEYAAALGVDLCFQNFSMETMNFRKIYGPPHGCLLLARINGELVGCVAVRGQDNAVCEMKRLYVKQTYRGTGLGRSLAESAISHAKRLGYTRMVLDTLPSMVAAQSLYASLGFCDVDSYYSNSLHGVRYLACELVRSEQSLK